MSSIKRHTLYNIAGAIIPILATMVTLPIYLRTIGEERYGVLIILWTLLGYFGLFDLGLGRAVTNRIAAFKDRTAREREEVFWTALAINLALGCVGALILWGAGAITFKHFVDVPGVLAKEVQAALPWMVLAFPVYLASGVMSGALMGREEFLAKNVVDVGIGLSIQLAPLAVALLIGPVLPGLVIAVLTVRAIGCLALFGLCVRKLPIGLSPRLARIHIRPLLGFGGWITITAIVSPLLSTLDRVIIGAVAGVNAVTYYTVPFSLASRLSVIPGSLASALFPRFSSLRKAENDALFESAVWSLVVIATPLAIVGLFIMEPFLTWWVSVEFASKSAPIGEILVIGLWANSLARIPFAKLQAEGKPGIVASFHLAEVLPYLAVLWIALEWKGAFGAAVAWSIRVWADAALLFWASRFKKGLVLVNGSVVLGCAVTTVIFTSGSEWQGIAVRLAVCIAVGAWTWRTAPENLKQSVSRSLARLQRSTIIKA